MLRKFDRILNEESAENKYRQYRNKDPFPKVPCALLNSADIINYVDETAMINPFFVDEDSLKPASYSIRVAGKYKYWDETNKPVEGTLSNEGETFTLRRNTIAFVSLESRLRLPHYIAARFNLQIKLVHKGILLGTGPLVDPGFEGNLFIPLHNLTDNDYIIKYKDPLIWMEFTKISNSEEFVTKMNACKDPLNEIQNEKFFPFKRLSLNIDPYQYLVKASPHKPIVSSLLTFIEEQKKIQDNVKEAQSKTDAVASKAQESISRINVGIIFSAAGFIGVLLTILGFVFSMLNNYKTDLNNLKNEINQVRLNRMKDSLQVINLLEQIDTSRK